MAEIKLTLIKAILEKEIEWCDSNRGKSEKGSDFEDGFIKGLKQAIFLVSAVDREGKTTHPFTFTECQHGFILNLCLICYPDKSRAYDESQKDKA